MYFVYSGKDDIILNNSLIMMRELKPGKYYNIKWVTIPETDDSDVCMGYCLIYEKKHVKKIQDNIAPASKELIENFTRWWVRAELTAKNGCYDCSGGGKKLINELQPVPNITKEENEENRKNIQKERQASEEEFRMYEDDFHRKNRIETDVEKLKEEIRFKKRQINVLRYK